MSGLKSLGACYLVAASAFTVAATLSAHRDTVEIFNRRFHEQVLRPAVDFARARDEEWFDPALRIPVARARLELAPQGPDDARLLAHAAVPPQAPARIAPRDVATASLPMGLPLILAPDLPPERMAPAAPPSRTAMASTPAVSESISEMLGPAERAAVTERFMASLSPELLKNFSLFLYVSKAEKGPLAQRLYVFAKNEKGDLALRYDWAASTGREQVEISPLGRHTRTDTPTGFYELDPDRMYRRYHSHAWAQPMPYAMFFNWEQAGTQTGLAIHAASGTDIAKLGSRASAGCVHISPEHAAQLFEMIKADYRGPVPRLAYDRPSQTMSRTGALMHDSNGRLVKTDGYKVLISIDDFGGGPLVATLY